MLTNTVLYFTGLHGIPSLAAAMRSGSAVPPLLPYTRNMYPIGACKSLLPHEHVYLSEGKVHP